MVIYSRLIAALAGGILLSMSPLACLALPEDTDKKLDLMMESFIKKWDVPAAQMAVYQKGKIVYSKAFGFSDESKKAATTTDNLFRIASISKVITACAIWQLIESGKIKLDDSAFDILSDLTPPAGALVDPRLKEITIQNLLEHSGGWTLEKGEPQAMYTRLAADVFHEPRPAKPVTIVRYMMGQPLDYDPGSKSVYSNFGYNVLGRIVEKISGQTYFDYVKTYILAPAGISDMALGRTSQKEALPKEVFYYAGKNMPEVWSVLDSEAKRVSYPYGGDCAMECLDSHGGWLASSEDLVKFAAALSGTGSGAPLLKSATYIAMLTPSKFELPDQKGTFRAFGCLVRPGTYRWMHAGALVGTSSVLYDLGGGVMFACVFNHLPDDMKGYFGAINKTFVPLIKNAIRKQNQI